MLPQRLWSLVEALASRSAKEPSEVMADAVRALVEGGGQPANIRVVSGASTSVDDNSDTPVITADTGAVEAELVEGYGEPPGSDNLREVLLKVMRTVEKRDAFIKRHAEAVAELAVSTAQQMKLDKDTTTLIELGALAHDLGKLRIPESVLDKRGRLTTDEWELVREYPLYSEEMVAQFTHLGAVVPLVRGHQERWDGSGYPDHLKGKKIPIGAQIIGICDVYHVLTSERAYRPALSAEVARDTIAAAADRLWNPKLSKIFLDRVLNS